MQMSSRCLEIENLTTEFALKGHNIRPVAGLGFHINSGETVGLVGESGCGKSVTALSIMRLLPRPQGKVVQGRVLFKGRDLLKMTEKQMRAVRGNEISIIFQEPMTSLNPLLTIGLQITEVLRLHQKLSKREAFQKAAEMLALVGIPTPAESLKQYPHQLSGGMRQRVMIASALCCMPSLLIADEPTTALDVTIQAQILGLIKSLKTELGMSVLIITHDLGIVAQSVQRILVMYAGQVVEEGEVKDIFKQPIHPYTKSLLNCIPRIDVSYDKLHVIPGEVPIPGALKKGCTFHPRCKSAIEKCRFSEPPFSKVNSSHSCRCWLITKS